MRRHQNTLYITSEGAWLSKERQNVVVSVDKKEIGRVPVHTIGALVAFGRVMISPPLMGACGRDGISITHLDEHGRFLARIEGPVSGNVLLRRTQYRWADDNEKRLPIIRAIIAGKALNQRTVLARNMRDYGKEMSGDQRDKMQAVIDRIAHITRRTQKPSLDAEALRGMEGEAARFYFSVFNMLIRGKRKKFRFNGRNRRPPLDRVNALLSFSYALLLVDCRSALETVGLDPAVGYLHTDRPGRASLALDLMEEFRPFMADRLVLSLINRRQIRAKHFDCIENGAVLLNEEGRKKLLIAWQERKRDELIHPFLR